MSRVSEPSLPLQSDWWDKLPPELRPPDPSTPRGRILNAARQLFAGIGYDGTTTRAISEAAEVNLAMVHYYFGSKEQLYQRVLALQFIEMAQKASSLLHPGLPPEDRIVELPIRLMDAMRNDPHWATLIRREVAAGGHHLQQALKALGDFGPLGLRHLYESAYREGVNRGSLRDLPPHAVRECIIALAHGMLFMRPFFQAVFDKNTDDETTWEEWRLTIRTMLREGLCVKKEES